MDRAMVSISLNEPSSIRNEGLTNREVGMEQRIKIYLLALLLLVANSPAFAQVKRVTADAKGIT